MMQNHPIDLPLRHILLVEADSALAKDVCAALDAAGLGFTLVTSRARALQFLIRHQAGLILLDRKFLASRGADCGSAKRFVQFRS